jgi:ABC-2 type transport system permease protein
MRKFWAIFKIVSQHTLSDRAERFVWFLIELLPMIVLVNVWYSLEKIGQISKYEMNALITYQVIVLFITRVSSIQFEEWFSDYIKDGNFSFDILKPKPIKLGLAADQLAKRLSSFFYVIPILVYFAPIYVPLVIQNGTFVKFILFLGLLIITTIQKFFLSWIISLSAFWFEQADYVVHARWLAEGMLGGAWLPLSFFPIWWQNIAMVSPFYSWYYFSIQILIKSNISINQIITQLIVALLWMISLIIISELFWQKSIKRYAAIGG